MNTAAKELAMQLAEREYSLIDYRNKMVRMQNMGCICHCSAEIDMGTLLYFSVNDMYLGKGSFVVLLFSQVGRLTTDQEEGRDVFGRMYTYTIIEEVAKETFTGHYSFYSSELDGRLVVIINFPFGLMPDISIVDYLDVASAEVCEKCKTRYDMDVITYISDPTDTLRNISSIYMKLLDRATLHRYTEHIFDGPVYHVRMLPPKPPTDRVISLEQQLREIVNLLLSGGDPHPPLDVILKDMAEHRASGVDELKRMFGDCFEELCRLCSQVGIKLKRESLRRALFQITMDSIHWREAEAWMHKFLDDIASDYAERTMKATRRHFDEAVQYIDEHLAETELSVERTAAAVGCSVSALSKVFRRQLNTSVAKYIRDARLEKALLLIRRGSTVKATCEVCGFGSTETFHRTFKARYGITPGQLRGKDMEDAE
ncbi:MAG: helix-turn-helix domain-containing protein [Oscillospiraceae bacterium]